MKKWWNEWRVRRIKIRAWKRYHAALDREGYYESLGLGHPEWVEAPPFPDPRLRGVDL